MTTYTAINSNGYYGAYGETWKVRITTSAPKVEALIPQYDRAKTRAQLGKRGDKNEKL